MSRKKKEKEEVKHEPIQLTLINLETKKKPSGIGKFAMNLMVSTQESNKEILAQVREQFPTAKTTYECIAWYRSKLRRDAMLEATGK